MEDEKDAEIVHIKRQAENTIRNLKTLQAEKSPMKYNTGNSPNVSPMKRQSQIKMTSTPRKPTPSKKNDESPDL